MARAKTYGGRVRDTGGLGPQRYRVDLPEEYAARPSLPPLFVCGMGLWLSCALSFSAATSWPAARLQVLAAASAALSLLLLAALLRTRANMAVCLAMGLALGLLCGGAGAIRMQQGQQLFAQLDQGKTQATAFVLEQDTALTTTGFSQGYAALARVRTADGPGPRIRLVAEGVDEPPRFGDALTGTATWSALEPGSDYALQLWQQGAVGVAYVKVRQGSGPSGAKQSPGNPDASVADTLMAPVLRLRNAVLDAVERQAAAQPATGGAAAAPASAAPAAAAQPAPAQPAAAQPAALPDEAGVLQALVAGYRANLRDTDAYAAFQTAGLAHLVAVSGAHLAIVGSMLAAALKLLRVGKLPSIAVQAAFMALYVVFAGAPVSALRAAIMALLGLLSFLPRRRSSSLSALGLCVVVCVVADPSTATSLSFLLSAGATIGIAVFSALFASWLRAWFPRMGQALTDGLAATLAANVLSLGVSAAQFSQLPLVSPVANLVAAPLLSIVCCTGLAGSLVAAALPWTGAVTVGLPLLGAKLLVGMVTLLAHLPLACVPVQLDYGWSLAASVVAAVALWALWPRLRGRTAAALAAAASACALCFALLAPLLAGTQIVALDVGQGDAILLRSAGRAILVDTGTDDALLRQALARNGVLALDAVLITHPDDDHCGSLEALASVVRIGQVGLSSGTFDCPCPKCGKLVRRARAVARGGRVTQLRKGAKLSLGDLTLRVIWPGDFADQGGNADSLSVLVEADLDRDGSPDQTALLCGDAEQDQVQAMLDQGLLPGPLPQLGIYKVGHHGSKVAIDQEQARRLAPRIALISVGARNRYGHPSQQVLDALGQAGARILRTDQQGDLRCTLRKDGIAVRTQVR